MDFFVYNSGDGSLDINEPQIFLIKEFNALLDLERNKCKEDKTGKLKLRARKELTYIWLKMDPKSPYAQFTELEAHTTALDDSRLTKEEYDDEVFRAACRKYQEILDSDRILRMIKAARGVIDKLEYYLTEEVDFSEKNLQTGAPIYKAKDVIAEIKNLGDVITGLKDLETMYKKGQESVNNGSRGDATPGRRDMMK
jgi:hypothetical protein